MSITLRDPISGESVTFSLSGETLNVEIFQRRFPGARLFYALDSNEADNLFAVKIEHGRYLPPPGGWRQGERITIACELLEDSKINIDFVNRIYVSVSNYLLIFIPENYCV